MAAIPLAGQPASATTGTSTPGATSATGTARAPVAPRVPDPSPGPGAPTAPGPGAALVREPGHPALPEPCVLLKVGEIVLKGGNRHHFERILQENIRRAVRDLGVGVRLWNRNGVMVLRLTSQHGASQHGPGAEAAMDRVADRVSSVMGIARVCRAARVAKDPEAAISTAVAATSVSR